VNPTGLYGVCMSQATPHIPPFSREECTGALAGRRVLVTGGATGIGSAAVDVLAVAGARVAATYHNAAPSPQSEAAWFRCDATDADAAEQTFADVADALGGLDVLVHAAGLWHPGVPGRIAH
jgi:3-oxoacyl-[acyl-carrier protein] reductase